MNTPASLTPGTLATFEASLGFRLSEYILPRGGWRSFNEIFARHFKPKYRPLAAVEKSPIIISPTDFKFHKQLEISPSSFLTAKGTTWSISELMADIPFKDYFHGGTWIHGWLTESNYHRIYAPIGGKVVEARVISGQHYALIETMNLETEANGSKVCSMNWKKKKLRKRRVFYIPNEAGYQFVQRLKLVVFETKTGMVVTLPVGVAVVSSVILFAEEGVSLRKR